MEYTKLEEINAKLKTTPIKDKNYVEVNERIKAFWQLCPDGRIETEILHLQDNICVITAKVYEDKDGINPRATGTAYEKEGSTFINKTSYIENCETSAIGRALGIAGIGIDTSVASSEEVQNAILNQEGSEKVTDIEAKTIYGLLKKKDINLTNFLEYYGVSNTNELTKKQYAEALKKIDRN